jgi:hypothetical protein
MSDMWGGSFITLGAICQSLRVALDTTLYPAPHLNCCGCTPPCAHPYTHRYPVPPMEETHAKTEVIIGNWMKARNNRSQVGTHQHTAHRDTHLLPHTAAVGLLRWRWQ